MVSKGHPDKVADLISDMVADHILSKDKDYHTAIETLLKDREVVIAGEATYRPYNAELKRIVKTAFENVGYDYKPKIRNLISRQSPDINRGVLTGGAGDQGIVYGYATNESASYLPKGYWLSARLMQAVDNLAEKNSFVKADGKCEIVTDKKGSVKKVIVSKQNTDEKQTQRLATEIIRSFPAMKAAEILINPTGKFEVGGPFGDCGLTGRKISVDTYGGAAHHGGGCYSGKDLTKVDRSGAYFARMLAVEAVKKGLGDKIEISLSFAIGRPEIQEAVCTYCEKGGSINSSVDVNKVNQWLAKRLEKTTVDSMTREVRKLFCGKFSDYTSYGHFTGIDWSRYPAEEIPAKKPARKRLAKKAENGGN